MDEKLVVQITAEISDLKRQLNNAKEQITDTAKATAHNSEKMQAAFKKAGSAMATGAKMGATAIGAMGTALVSTSALTEDYRIAQAKLKTAFESAGGSAETAKGVYNDLYRVLGDSDVSVEAANHLAKLTTNQKDLSEWTKICEGVYATFGDSLPIEGLTEASNETVKTGKVTGVLADALNWAGISEDDFNDKLAACNSEAEREKLLRETLSEVYDKAAEGYEKNAKNILDAHEAQNKLNDSLAQVGELVTPLVSVLKIGLAGALQSIIPGLKQVSAGIQDLANGVDGGAEKISEGVTKMVTGLLDKIQEVLPTVLEVGVQIIQSLIEGILQALPNVVESVADLIPTIIEAITSLLPTLLEVGVEVIVALIEGITQAIPTLIQATIEVIPRLVEALVTGIPQILAAGIQLFTALVEAIPVFLPQLIAMIPSIVQAIIVPLIENIPTLLTAGVQLFLALVTAIPQFIPNLIAAIPQIITTIVTTLIASIPAILQAGIDLFTGLVDAIVQVLPDIKGGLSNIADAVGNMVGTIKNKFEDMKQAVSSKVDSLKSTVVNRFNSLKESSQSKIQSLKDSTVNRFNEMKETSCSRLNAIKDVATNGFSIIRNNISSNLGNAKSIAISMFEGIRSGISNKINGAKNAVHSAIGAIKNAFHFTWRLPHLALPHISISGSFSINPPRAPHFGISWYKDGGVFDSPTLFGYGNGMLGGLGEHGAEAVVPLEKNTKWLDKIAERLNDKGNTPIILQVDGKTFATIACDSINSLTRQRGSIPLTLV